ncbi:zinc ribbon domain-containing protein [bacterium]|nr:zinc ribbon domain-containing protein [bacterium]
MPVFDYECKHCGRIYEELVTSSSTPDSDIECPECGEHQSVRRMSAPSVLTGRVSSFSGGAGCGSGGFT